MKRGFTLVELLIAATIIAILAGIGVTSYTSLSRQSRDARRKADLGNFRSALEFYRADNDYYPASLAALDPEYLNEVLVDPKAGRSYVYCTVGTSPNFTNFNLYASLEDTSATTVTPAGTCSPANCGSGVSCNYKLTPLGAE